MYAHSVCEHPRICFSVPIITAACTGKISVRRPRQVCVSISHRATSSALVRITREHHLPSLDSHPCHHVRTRLFVKNDTRTNYSTVRRPSYKQNARPSLRETCGHLYRSHQNLLAARLCYRARTLKFVRSNVRTQRTVPRDLHGACTRKKVSVGYAASVLYFSGVAKLDAQPDSPLRTWDTCTAAR